MTNPAEGEEELRTLRQEQGPNAEILSPHHEAYTELLLSSVPEKDPDWLDVLVERRKRGELPTAESIN